MSRRLQPNDIPAPDTRYDFVVLKSGQMKRAEESVPAIIAMIDNGPFKGKRVSSEVPHMMRPAQRVSAVLRIHATAMIDGEWKAVGLDYTDSNPRIRYSLEDFGDPQGQPEVAVKEPRQKFRR
jgi:hypothetical protein